MTSAQWQIVKKVFTEALERPHNQRETYITDACGQDAEVLEEVRSLVKAHLKESPLHRVKNQFISPILAGIQSEQQHGMRLGVYTIVRELGRGGMGNVYLARDEHLHRDAALKMLPVLLQDDDEASARFFMEARAASALDHPNVCTIYGIDTTDQGQPYIAMAYYDGQTLKDWIAENKGTLRECLDIAAQIGEGLNAVHQAGIIHRDIKPANIMLTRQGTVKIVDFGIARIKDAARGTRSDARMGTASYMAPEQVEDLDVDARIDIWSLGVVLYEMITGIRPFGGANNHTILNNVLRQAPKPLSANVPDIPPCVDTMVLKMLEKNRDHRYQEIDEILEAIKACYEEIDRLDRSVSSSLPVHLTSFVGRESDINTILKLLRNTRLLTLLGPGGIGKTRLAIETANRLNVDTHYVPLGTHMDPEEVPAAIAHALGPGRISDHPLEDVKQALMQREAVLILDNFEQLMKASPVIAELLAACSALRILVTSRTPTGIPGEQEYPVHPLGLPGAVGGEVKTDESMSVEAILQYPAVRLFVERAKATRVDFELSSENAPDVVALCKRLDGLPLALELAAARIKLFTPAMLNTRLADQPGLLKETGRERPERHHTLQQAIQWSYDLLDGHLKRMFRQVSVFSGGFTLEAAEAVLNEDDFDGTVIEAIFSLLDHSLLQRRDQGGEPRMYMLATIRAFSFQHLEQSGEAFPVKQRHAAYFGLLATSLEPQLTGPWAGRALDVLEREYDNFRVALANAEALRDSETGLKLSASLWRFAMARGNMHEGRKWIDLFLHLDGEAVPTRLRARALVAAASLSHNMGDNNKARNYLEESLPLWRAMGDQQGIISVLNNLSWVGCELCKLEIAKEHALEALALSEQLNEGRGKALALNNLGWVAMYLGDGEEMKVLHTKSLALRRAIGDDAGSSFAIANLGYAEVVTGNYDTALDLLSEAVSIAREVKDRHHLAWGLSISGWAYNKQGVYEKSLACLDEALPIWRTPIHPSGLAWALSVCASTHSTLNSLEVATDMLDEGLQLWQQVDTPWGVAWVYFEYGRIAEKRGFSDEARTWYQKSLDIRLGIKDQLGIAECMEGLRRL